MQLLDINEQPIGGGVREAKRRKKLITGKVLDFLLKWHHATSNVYEDRIAVEYYTYTDFLILSWSKFRS